MIDLNDNSNNKENESKKARFKRMAEARTNKIVDMVNLLGNLSNKSVYDYDADEISKIFNYIEEELVKAKSKFKDIRNSEKKFKL